MRWLKHLTASHQDEKITRLFDAAGHAGYGLWWHILEVIGQEITRDNPNRCSLTYSIRTWSRRLYLPPHLVRTRLELLAGVGLVSLRYEQGELEVRVPNILKYKDEYQEKSRHTPDTVGRKKEKEKEIQKEQENKGNGSATSASPVTFTGLHFNITERLDAVLAQAFPWINRPAQYALMDSWMEANPNRRPKSVSRFVHNWFSRERGNGNGVGKGSRKQSFDVGCPDYWEANGDRITAEAEAWFKAHPDKDPRQKA